MNESVYHYSLLTALILMCFLGFHMLIARVPEKKALSTFLLSRRLMGTALLILAANYSVHFAFELRLRDVDAAILFNMATYFLCYWLFSSALMILLEKSYITRRRFAVHLLLWLAYSALASSLSLFITDTVTKTWGTIALACLLVGYGLFLSSRLLRTYYKAVKLSEDTSSDDIGSYIRWLSVFTYWAIAFGVSCGLLTFLPDEYVFIWVLSAVPFYIYLYCCYQNYIYFHEQVENAIIEGPELAEDEEVPAYHTDIARRIEGWIDNEGYRKPGITLNELAIDLCTNRTYLSEHIHRTFNMSFRDWISDMRIEYAKRLMMKSPQMKIQDISEASGFLSISHFSRTFSEKEGCSPARWRKNNTV